MDGAFKTHVEVFTSLLTLLTGKSFNVRGANFTNREELSHISITLDHGDRSRESELPQKFEEFPVEYVFTEAPLSS